MKFLTLCLVLCVAAAIAAPAIDPSTSFMQLGAEPMAAAEPAPAALLEAGCGVNGCPAGGPTGRLASKAKKGGAKDKLEIALSAIKQDILVRDRQVNDEKAWVAQVRKVVEQYNKKVKRVLSDIEKTKGEVKVLFKKKKQIENLKIQRQLEKKLKDATSDLTTLKSALSHVRSKASEFSKTKNQIKQTIISIHTQLAKLKGVKDPKKLRAIASKLNKD
jgi:DNA repair exonuclease SbcCD ATPase subunit